MTLRLRPPKGRPASKPSNNDYVIVKHPGYSNSSTLVTFAAADYDDSCHGIHFGTVHVACAILANNRHDGWLSRSRSYAVAGDRITQEDDSILPAGEYFYHVPLVDDFSRPPLAPYPVVPNFRAWRFPHGNIPQSWERALDRATILDNACIVDPSTRDQTCRLTDFSLACDYAHLIPASEKDWFAENDLQQYFPPSRRGRDTVDLSVNTILLRTDVHRLYDGMKWSIVPKSGTLVAHITQHSAELEQEYHNVPLQPLRGIVPEYLYARFAWDTTPNMLGFLQAGQERYLAIRQPDGSIKEEKFSPSECKKMAQSQGRLRSASPDKLTKRKHEDVQERGPIDDDFEERFYNPEVDSGIGSFSGDLAESESSIDSDEDEPANSTYQQIFGLEKAEVAHVVTRSGHEVDVLRGRKRLRVTPGSSPE